VNEEEEATNEPSAAPPGGWKIAGEGKKPDFDGEFCVDFTRMVDMPFAPG
jgi:hypothetical protein